MKKIVMYVIFLTLLSALIFTSCEDLVGLGAKVNTEKPVIKTPEDGDNKPGSFLSGDSNRIWLEVEQEYGIAQVYMEVEYLSKTTGKTERTTIDAYYDENKKQWYVDLDTTDMEDGTIKTWVTAIDVDGNKATTTDIIYFVKNLPPQIKLTMPAVGDDEFDNDFFLDNLKNEDPLYLGFELMGLATDDYGIEEGYPKIMIWPDNFTDVDIDGLPMFEGGRYGTWYPLVVNNDKRGLTVKKFSWPMLNLREDSPGVYRLPQGDEPRTNLSPLVKYRFRIMTKDLFGNINYYPNRTDNKRGPGNEAMDPADIPRKFVEISYIAADIPIIQITDCPQYYNAAKDFKIDFLISSANPMHDTEPIYAYIKDQTDETQQIVGGPYYPTLVTGSTSSPYRYTLTISAAEAKTWKNIPATGVLYVFLKAKDNQQKEGPDTYQVFNYDITPPEVPFDRPVILTETLATGKLNGGEYTILYPSAGNPKWVTGNVTVGGISKDNSGIKEVYYHIGKLGDDKISPAAREALYDDDANWNNTNLHTSIPASGWGGSVYAWTYTQFFPIGYKALNTGTVQELSDLNGYAVNSSTETVGKERFYLPFYVKVLDAAGNRTIVHYKLCVDPLLDEPQVNIIYPDAGAIVGGTVRLTGVAEDNFWMHTVLMRIHKDGETGSSTDSNSGYWYKPPATDPNDPWANFFFPHPLNGFEAIPPFTVPGDRAGWFKIKTVGDGPMVNWTCSVNGDGKLNPPDSGPETVDVVIEVIAIDTNEVTHQIPHITGPIERRTVKFSKNIPTIENEKITTNGDTRDYAEGTASAAGKFTISMDVSAIEGLHRVSVKVAGYGETVLIQGRAVVPGLNSAIWNVTTPIDKLGRQESVITITVDSAGSGGLVSVPYGSTSVMNLEMYVEDGTENQFSTTKQYRIGIDNFYPSAEIETSMVAFDDPANSKYFYVEGTAQDWGPGSGQIQGLERVLVYFERATITYGVGAPTWSGRKVTGNGTYLTQSGAVAGLASNNTYFMNYNVRDTAALGFSESDQGPNNAAFRMPRFVKTGTVWTSPLAMVIDNAENDPLSDFDGDGTFGERWNGLTDKTWGARMMISNGTTQQFPDGPYMVHYIIMDQAGNATHYQKDIYVESNKPRITSINIGTDINFDDTVANWTNQTNPGEYRENAYNVDLSSEATGRIETPDSEFRIRNSRFGLRLTIEKGTGNKTATVTNVSRGAATAVTNMERGKVYQIAATAANTDFTKYGAPNGYTNTVFVATGEGKGGGTVFPLNQVSTATQSFSLGTPASITASNTYNQFPAAVADRSDGLFLVKVYDSTVTTGVYHPELDQLAHAVLLQVSINNTDNVPPQIEIADFGRKHITSLTGVATNYDDNELTAWGDVRVNYTDFIDTTGTVKNGYVQYINDNIPATSTTANISGKVIFNGKVTDNHRIDRITVQIPGYNNGTEFNIATRNTTTGILQAANTIAGEREFRIVNPSVPQFTLSHGHTVVWQFMWDSSKINAVAQNGVNVTFRVYDGVNQTNLPPGTTAPTNPKVVNVVPYISEILTPLSGAYASNPSAFNRSALGGYPVKQGDVITIKGFNLGGTRTPAVTTAVTIGTVALGGTLVVSADGTQITGGTIGAANTVVSGPLQITVGPAGNTVTSFNNSTDKNKTTAYNKEPNGVNNNILDNSRYMYVWNTGYLDNTTVSTISNPFMRMDNAGNRLLSYGLYTGSGTGALVVRKNNTNNFAAISNTNRLTNTTVATGGTNNSWYAAGSDITAGNYPFKFGRSTAAGANSATRGGTIDPASVDIVAAIGANSNRFKIPRIAVQPTNGAANRTDAAPDRLLLGYFDDDNKALNIIYGSNGAANNGYIGTNIPVTVVANDTTTHRGSMYTAVGFLNNGLPLIAWFDRTNSNLVFSWGSGTPTGTGRTLTPTATNTDANGINNTRFYTFAAGHGLTAGTPVVITYNNGTPEYRVVRFVNGNNIKFATNATTNTAGDIYSAAANNTHSANVSVHIPGTTIVNTTQAQWQANAVIIDSSNGSHVDMAVDGANNVHLAYYDASNGGLWYALIPATAATGAAARPNANNITPVKVDTFLSAGTKIMINVRQETVPTTRYVPYISYAHASFKETKNSIRVAWRTDFTTTAPLAGTDITDMFTGKWEVMTVPVSNIPNIDEFVCNGVPTALTMPTMPGGTSTFTYNTTINQTIVLGYLTDSNYEGAVLKGDIRSVPPILQK